MKKKKLYRLLSAVLAFTVLLSPFLVAQEELSPSEALRAQRLVRGMVDEKGQFSAQTIATAGLAQAETTLRNSYELLASTTAHIPLAFYVTLGKATASRPSEVGGSEPSAGNEFSENFQDGLAVLRQYYGILSYWEGKGKKAKDVLKTFRIDTKLVDAFIENAKLYSNLFEKFENHNLINKYLLTGFKGMPARDEWELFQAYWTSGGKKTAENFGHVQGIAGIFGVLSAAWDVGEGVVKVADQHGDGRGGSKTAVFAFIKVGLGVAGIVAVLCCIPVLGQVLTVVGLIVEAAKATFDVLGSHRVRWNQAYTKSFEFLLEKDPLFWSWAYHSSRFFSGQRFGSLDFIYEFMQQAYEPLPSYQRLVELQALLEEGAEVDESTAIPDFQVEEAARKKQDLQDTIRFIKRQVCLVGYYYALNGGAGLHLAKPDLKLPELARLWRDKAIFLKSQTTREEVAEYLARKAEYDKLPSNKKTTGFYSMADSFKVVAPVLTEGVEYSLKIDEKLKNGKDFRAAYYNPDYFVLANFNNTFYREEIGRSSGLTNHEIDLLWTRIEQAPFHYLPLVDPKLLESTTSLKATLSESWQTDVFFVANLETRALAEILATFKNDSSFGKAGGPLSTHLEVCLNQLPIEELPNRDKASSLETTLQDLKNLIKIQSDCDQDGDQDGKKSKSILYKAWGSYNGIGSYDTLLRRLKDKKFSTRLLRKLTKWRNNNFKMAFETLANLDEVESQLNTLLAFAKVNQSRRARVDALEGYVVHRALGYLPIWRTEVVAFTNKVIWDFAKYQKKSSSGISRTRRGWDSFMDWCAETYGPFTELKGALNDCTEAQNAWFNNIAEFWKAVHSSSRQGGSKIVEVKERHAVPFSLRVMQQIDNDLQAIVAGLSDLAARHEGGVPEEFCDTLEEMKNWEPLDVGPLVIPTQDSIMTRMFLKKETENPKDGEYSLDHAISKGFDDKEDSSGIGGY
jgi:hypothetical protein